MGVCGQGIFSVSECVYVDEFGELYTSFFGLANLP